MDNVLEGRFYFPLDEVAAAIESLRPDIVLCEVPEHVRAFRMAMKRAKHSAPIIAMVEHVDFYEETRVDVPFMLRQIDGALTCDRLVFPLEGMRHEWMRQSHFVLNDSGYGIRDVLAEVWPGLVDPDEVDSQMTEGQRLKGLLHRLHGTHPIVFLISRLSDGQRTHFEEIIEASNILYNGGFEHTLLVANPNEARDWDWVREMSVAYRPSHFGEQTLTREQYLQLLWAADLVPVMYPLDKIYSVGAIEAAYAENVVLSTTLTPFTMACTTAPQDIAFAMRSMLGDPSFTRHHAVTTRTEALVAHGVRRNIDIAREAIEEVADARVA
jgi:hypothetical protein